MKYYYNSVAPKIESMYHKFTTTEKTIADFFILEKKESEYSAKTISQKLFVSESSLSRFAKKCGYEGYREFIYDYKLSFYKNEGTESYTNNVLDTYHKLLKKSQILLDITKLDRICSMFAQKNRVYVYGIGSSGLAAKEMKFRFMRIGMNIEAITDSQIMKMNVVNLNEDCIVIGISVSGETTEVMSTVKEAKQRGAYTILITAKKMREEKKYYNEIVELPTIEYSEYGKSISSQVPVLIIIDFFYAYYFKKDTKVKEALYEYTLYSIKDKQVEDLN